MNSLQELAAAISFTGTLGSIWGERSKKKEKHTSLLIPSLSFLPVHLLVFEKRPEPPPDHGAPLHHPQTPGGAGPHVQPGVQGSLSVQAASPAPEEGRRPTEGCRRSLAELPAFFLFFTSLLIPASKTVNSEHSLHCCANVSHQTPLFCFSLKLSGRKQQQLSRFSLPAEHLVSVVHQ